MRADLKNGYWQIPVAPASREYTAFTVPGRGLFHWKVTFGTGNLSASPGYCHLPGHGTACFRIIRRYHRNRDHTQGACPVESRQVPVFPAKLEVPRPRYQRSRDTNRP